MSWNVSYCKNFYYSFSTQCCHDSMFVFVLLPHPGTSTEVWKSALVEKHSSFKYSHLDQDLIWLYISLIIKSTKISSEFRRRYRHNEPIAWDPLISTCSNDQLFHQPLHVHSVSSILTWPLVPLLYSGTPHVVYAKSETAVLEKHKLTHYTEQSPCIKSEYITHIPIMGDIIWWFKSSETWCSADSSWNFKGL